jgi:uncharacterized membrane protein YkvA (DUF1232 family)
VELIVGLLATLAVAWLVFVVVLWLHRPSREVAGQAIRIVPDVVRLGRALMTDGETPTNAKVAVLGMLIYLLSPIDLIPDFIPGLGQLDDVVVVALVLRWTGRRVGIEGLRRHWFGTDDGFGVLLRMLGL